MRLEIVRREGALAAQKDMEDMWVGVRVDRTHGILP